MRSLLIFPRFAESTTMKNLFQPLLLLIAGADRARAVRQVRYLKVENEILRSKLPAKVTVTEKEKTGWRSFTAVDGVHMALAMAERDAIISEPLGTLRSGDLVNVNDALPTLAARGHRLEVYFRLGMTDKAFDDIAVLMPHAPRDLWILPWCPTRLQLCADERLIDRKSHSLLGLIFSQ